MNLSRRSFLRGVITCAAAVAVAKIAPLLPSLPKIVGDGIHDDSPGLNALFAGEPFEAVADCVKVSNANHITLSNGIFRLCQPLVIKRDFTIIMNSDFYFDGVEGPMLDCTSLKQGAYIANCGFWWERPFDPRPSANWNNTVDFDSEAIRRRADLAFSNVRTIRDAS